MLFRLALALGKTVSELGRSLSYKEFREWCAFYQIEPWGDYRADMRIGILSATVKNIHSQWVGAPADAKPIDFMPYVDQYIRESPETISEPETPLTDDELAIWADATLFGITPDNP